MLKKAIRAKYTCELKHGAVRLAEVENSIACAPCNPGVLEQTLLS